MEEPIISISAEGDTITVHQNRVRLTYTNLSPSTGVIKVGESEPPHAIEPEDWEDLYQVLSAWRSVNAWMYAKKEAGL